MTVSRRYDENDRSNLRLSRSAMRRRLSRRSRKTARQKQQIEQLRDINEDLRDRLRQAIEQRQHAEQKLILQQAAPSIATSDYLMSDRPLLGHQFGVKLIAASIELAKRIGFRATEFVWSFLFELLGIDLKVPSHDAIQQWTLRFGVASLQDTAPSG